MIVITVIIKYIIISRDFSVFLCKASQFASFCFNRKLLKTLHNTNKPLSFSFSSSSFFFSLSWCLIHSTRYMTRSKICNGAQEELLQEERLQAVVWRKNSCSFINLWDQIRSLNRFTHISGMKTLLFMYTLPNHTLP